MSDPTYSMTTFGCRVNHAEARELESILLRRGLLPATPGCEPDLHVVHTCSVTSPAVRKSRHAVRQARKGSRVNKALGAPSPRAPSVIVTGCYATTNAAEAAIEAGSSGRVVPHEADDGSTLLERFAHEVDAWLESCPHDTIRRSTTPSSTTRIIPLPVTLPRAGAGRHIRAELKVQDGCDAHCTFCIIPKIRKTLRSKSISDAVREATRLVDLGHPEIVLTGIFLGAFGHETALRRRQADRSRHHLAELLDAIARIPGLRRVRLSSLEPGDVSEVLLDAMVANMPVVVPHLHLPLQSGSDSVLKRMNRQYRAGDYLRMVAMVNDALTSADGLPPALTTDIMCGFPGETESDFERTLELVRSVAFLHMHLFPFSPRPGTAAAKWSDTFIQRATIQSRIDQLRSMQSQPVDGLSIRFRRRLLHRTVRVILEGGDPAMPGTMIGRCDHYALIHVRTDDPAHRRGATLEVRIDEVNPTHTIGVPCARSIRLPVLSC